MPIDENIENLFQYLYTLLNSFNHLKENRLTYCEHFHRAMSIWFTMIVASSKNFIHAFYPDVFTTSASDAIEYLQKDVFGKSYEVPDQLP